MAMFFDPFREFDRRTRSRTTRGPGSARVPVLRVGFGQVSRRTPSEGTTVNACGAA